MKLLAIILSALVLVALGGVAGYEEIRRRRHNKRAERRYRALVHEILHYNDPIPPPPPWRGILEEIRNHRRYKAEHPTRERAAGDIFAGTWGILMEKYFGAKAALEGEPPRLTASRA